MGEGDRDRCRAIPFVLAAGVKIDFRFTAHHGHRLGSGRPHRHEFRADGVCDGNCLRCGARAADDHAGLCGHLGQIARFAGAKNLAKTGQGDRAHFRPSVHAKRDMDGPVATLLSIFAGAVHRVDDPDALFGKAFAGVLAFFGQKAVVGALVAQSVAQELVRGLVTSVAQCLAFEHAARAHFQQDLACASGEVGCQFGVSHAKSRQ